MKAIPLTQGQKAMIDDKDYELVSHLKWHAIRIRRTFYAQSRLSTKPSKAVLMHRFILDAPSEMEVDHRNGDTLDNRRNNLRIATRPQNGRNLRMNRRNTT